MTTAIAMFLECRAAGETAKAADWLAHVPAWQIAARFEDFAPQCPNQLSSSVERRPANALNIEIGAPLPRCSARPPATWRGVETAVLRWLGSGGSPLVFGLCARQVCDRLR